MTTAQATQTEALHFGKLLTRSSALGRIFASGQRVAATEATVLLLGETGTGKELFARALHEHSPRRGRFVAVNCGAIPEALIESELFGYEKGSFTGASGTKAGLFRHANGGTLFLDEVGSLPHAAQFSLLRALQEGAVRPVGGKDEVPVDVRIVAATSVPLDQAVARGDFREDLLYRLDVIRFVIPPLRERPEDVLLLQRFFSRRLSEAHGAPVPEVTPGFEQALLGYRWPGNVRQLENFCERLVLTHDGAPLDGRRFEELIQPHGSDVGVVEASDGAAPSPEPTHGVGGGAGAPPAPDRVEGRAPPGPFERFDQRLPEVDVSQPLAHFLEPVTEELERRYLEAALRVNEGRIQATADMAGLSRRTLLRKIKKHRLDKRDYFVHP